MIVKWLGFMWFEYRVQGWVIVNMVIKLKVLYKIGDFWLAKQLLASQDGLCVVECDRFEVPFFCPWSTKLSWCETPIALSALDKHDGAA
jgi:hypothetical protein